ncbi:MAG: xanthine dehydrogenase family protein molybdopterin-binding subunit [Chloroflexi bacterium]|nr:xanthine dehydrogenase family protein molybdopterin-binding subunit [Chloroflexota bacterium]
MRQWRPDTLPSRRSGRGEHSGRARFPHNPPVGTAESSNRFVGKSIPRLEDRRFVTGTARYIADINMARQGHVAFVRSTQAHATLTKIDASAARSAPGVIAVVTGDELAASGVKPIRTPFATNGYIESDWPALAQGKVRFVGEAIAAVVAESRYLAEDAAELVEVEYDSLPAAVTIDAAMAPGAALVHDHMKGNLYNDDTRSFGEIEVDAAFAQAAFVVEGTFDTQRSAALPIECRGSVADYHAATGRFTLWSSTQLPHVVRHGLADCLGVPHDTVRVLGPDLGGGFGNKANMDPEQVVVCGLARMLGRPVKWLEDRRENLLASTHGQEERITARLAADAEGRFIALETDILLNGGAYSIFPDTPLNELMNCTSSILGPYRMKAYRYRARAVVTTTCPHGPVRGVARSQANFAFERLVETLAAKMNLDSIELRRRNLLLPAEMPCKTLTGLTRDGGDYAGLMDLAVERVGWRRVKAGQAAERAKGRYVGVGLASFAEEGASGTERRIPRQLLSIAGYDGAFVRMDMHGRVVVFSSAAGMGQGIETSFAQIAADELGVAPDHVTIRHNDTDMVPYGMGSTGSRSAVSSGGAVVVAARRVQAKLLTLAAHLLGVDAAAVRLRHGGVEVAADPARFVSIERLAWIAYRRAEGNPPGFEPGLEAVGFYDPPSSVSSGSTHAVVVEVDVETGAVRLLAYVVAEDAGILLNPAIVDGQIRGGAVQGIGKALFEEVRYDPDGQMLNASLMDFLAPTMSEVPPIEVVHMITPSPLTINGARGCGESGIIGSSAAIGNAIIDALGGRGEGLSVLPFTPERVVGLARQLGVRA